MSILNNLLKMITYQENTDREGFVLEETADDGHAARQSEPSPESEAVPQYGEKASAGRRAFKKPVRPANKAGCKPRRIEDGSVAGEGRPDQASCQAKSEQPANNLSVSASLEENREIVGKLYGLPVNRDIVVRDIVIGASPAINGFIVFIDGLVDKSVQDLLIQALMFFAVRPAPPEKGKLAAYVKDRLLPGNQVSVQSRFRDVLDAVNYGDTALFLEGCAEAVLVETKGWEHRSVERPTIEQMVRGPQEAFGETLRSNTALVRKLVKNENLTTEFLNVGARNRVNVAVMYMRDLADPALVAEVKRRVGSIKTDFIVDSGMLEEFIQENPYNLNPTIMATERPDRVAASIIDGKVALAVDGSPFVLIMPVTMYEMLHTGEEIYSRWQFGTFIRYLRALAFYLAFLLPGFYLAVILFHHEMIPTELLLAIAGNREKVPFPSLIEVLLMEISFELIREAGLRIPGVMGSTIGIVGALILGQAAVQANIVSPILVILVAVTGLSSFAIPYYSLAFALRIYRFFYIILGATLGVFGIAAGLFTQAILTANLKSFGVPYLAPAGPRTVAGADVVARLPVFFHENRPDYLNPQDITRQPEVSRGWLIRKDGGKDN
ncbi:MAG: Spore germination protein B1 [Pelotomaculum sp. PtaU1.Bin035]|nr:MAG: Spore germination protein B1 [Pelotomaculum sp. PtaU1.Bin035]